MGNCNDKEKDDSVVNNNINNDNNINSEAKTCEDIIIPDEPKVNIIRVINEHKTNNKINPEVFYNEDIDKEIVEIEDLVKVNKNFNEIYDIEKILHKINDANERLVCKKMGVENELSILRLKMKKLAKIKEECFDKILLNKMKTNEKYMELVTILSENEANVIFKYFGDAVNNNNNNNDYDKIKNNLLTIKYKNPKWILLDIMFNGVIEGRNNYNLIFTDGENNYSTIV
jgi:hypothetical protein